MTQENPYRASATEQSTQTKPRRTHWLVVVLALGLIGLLLVVALVALVAPSASRLSVPVDQPIVSPPTR